VVVIPMDFKNARRDGHIIAKNEAEYIEIAVRS